jgi:hypothetical protein
MTKRYIDELYESGEMNYPDDSDYDYWEQFVNEEIIEAGEESKLYEYMTDDERKEYQFLNGIEQKNNFTK